MPTATATLKVNETRADQGGMVVEFRDEWEGRTSAAVPDRETRVTLTVGDIGAGVLLGLWGFAVSFGAVVVALLALSGHDVGL